MKDEMIVIAALLVALGFVGSAYLLSGVDYSPKVNVSDVTSTPNVYVSSLPPEHVLSVSGTASTRVTPDLLNVYIRIDTNDTDAKTSQEENAVVSAGVIEELKSLGLKDNEIKSTSYSVQPIRESQRKCDDNGCIYNYILVGYRTTHSVNVRTTNLDLAGDIVDSATEFGENEVFVDSISFSLQDETRREVQATLLAEAGAAAKEKADAIAEGLGSTVGKLVQASESTYYPGPIYYDRAVFAEAAADSAAPVPTSLETGDVEVSATVNAGFEIN